ncbi:hypothetical protein QR77_18375 [Streptomyces sp. 150FB]|nr:hypothetical protein QR77_18375 [Streptomyces sp. 150FB]
MPVGRSPHGLAAALVIDQPVQDPHGDGELLQLSAYHLDLLAQLLFFYFEFGPAGRDRLTKVGFRILRHLTRSAQIVRTGASRTRAIPDD